MASQLLNVRLDVERRRKADVLRKRGVNLSDVVREAIDARYDDMMTKTQLIDTDAWFASIDQKYPASDDKLPKRTYSVHDRRQAAKAIRKHLKRTSK